LNTLIPLAAALLLAQTPPTTHDLLAYHADVGRHALLDWAPLGSATDAPPRVRPAAKIEIPELPPRVRLPRRLEALWPADVPKIDGLRLYTPTGYTQRLALKNGMATDSWFTLTQDDNDPPTVNPNRTFPYAVSGGLHNSTGWTSLKAAMIPGEVEVFRETAPVPKVSQPLPRYSWRFPAGTVFVDMLSKDGKCFELRTNTKGEDGKWKREMLYRDLDAAPENFHGAGRSCASCHKDAGASLDYGITVRGADGVFSWSPFIDGTFAMKKSALPDEESGLVEARHELKWLDYRTARQEAARTGRPILIDFGTDDCVYCKKMDETTFKDPEVVRLLSGRYVTCKVDGEKDPELARSFGVGGYPTLVITDSYAKPVESSAGYVDSAKLARQLRGALKISITASSETPRQQIVTMSQPLAMLAPRPARQMVASVAGCST
jgi:thiol-disulfide isomerase/thioredoxin